MELPVEYTIDNLQKCSYRVLQQTAKRMSLPSNVKKMYLVQLIHSKMNCSAGHLATMIRHVRLERHNQSLARRKAKKKKLSQQSPEISSTSNTKSPPISITPKRVGHIMIRYSPDQYSPPKPRANRININTSTINTSDRVLRSFRAIRNPNYVLKNALIGIMNSSSSEESVKSIGRVNVSVENKYQPVNMSSLLKRQSVGWRSSNEIVPVLTHRSANISPQPKQTQRRLSGIYPLNEEPKTPMISIRRSDGTISKINAYIKKSTPNMNKVRNSTMVSAVSERDISKNSSSVTNFRSMVSSFLDVSSETTMSCDEPTSSAKENQGEYTVYYHKKIRAEQVRSQRTKETARCENNECKLPKINAVFSKFNSVYERDVTQPIYVQVDNEPDILRNQSFFPDMNNYQTSMLESLYNLKNMYIMNQPLAQVTTTANTHCVYSTPIISTAKAQPSANVCSYYNMAFSQGSSHTLYGEEDPRLHDFFRNFRCDETLSDGTTIGIHRSNSADSIRSQQLGANVTIPEMVEDALEIISQDGDYMERMGMDVRMQCILCDWAGPKIILEYHIRKEHVTEIIQSNCSGEFAVRYTLGVLSHQQAWVSQVLEHRHELYTLSAKYQDPDRFAAIISSLSNDDITITGSITTYNKVTGEPFTWKGTIDQLPSNLVYECDPDCLKLDLSRMEVLPNSANLKLMNRELVIRSPNKVVVGQPELDSIQISLIIKFYD